MVLQAAMTNLAGLSAKLGLLLQSNQSDQEQYLLAIEDALGGFHAGSARFFAVRGQSLFDLVDNSIGQRGLNSKSILRIQSLLVTLRNGVYRENKAVEYILNKLGNLYTSQPAIPGKVAFALSCMDLAVLLEQSEIVTYTLLHNIKEACKGGRVGFDKQARAHLDLYQAKTRQTFTATRQEDLRRSECFDRRVKSTELEAATWFPFLRQRSVSGIHKALVIGKEGAGKTHLCHEIERNLESAAQVHRLELLGRTVGEWEDSILSLFNTFSAKAMPHLLLADNFDKLVRSPDQTRRLDCTNESKENHAYARSFSGFLAAMDSFIGIPRGTVVLVCTSKSNANPSLARFDALHPLSAPGYEERISSVKGVLGYDRDRMHKQIGDLAGLSVGLSFAEMAQNCRQAIVATHRPWKWHGTMDVESGIGDDTMQLLQALKNSLQLFAPASFLGGVVDGYVDMRVLSSEDLLDLSPYPLQSCPLFGHSSMIAWKELESNIVAPLCRAKELNFLLFNQEQSSEQAGLSCGVVLTGPAGSGKSTLAQHCAASAAALNPSIKLLEVSCTSMIHKEVGASEKSIHYLFDCARHAAPCVVILDDVAVISSVRGKDNTTEGTMDRVLSTLLTELDGVERDFPASSQDAGGIAVIGITQNMDWLDPALLRPGRLGRILTLGAPDQNARCRIALRQLEMDFPNLESAPGFELSQQIATKTEGLAGSSVIATYNDAKRSCLVGSAGCVNMKLPSPQEISTSMRDFITKSAS